MPDYEAAPEGGIREAGSEAQPPAPVEQAQPAAPQEELKPETAPEEVTPDEPAAEESEEKTED